MALLDFDVHHGNGTEACVAACAPHVKRFGITTPFSEGVQSFPVYRPWMGLEDSDNILFARWARLDASLITSWNPPCLLGRCTLWSGVLQRGTARMACGISCKQLTGGCCAACKAMAEGRQSASCTQALAGRLTPSTLPTAPQMGLAACRERPTRRRWWRTLTRSLQAPWGTFPTLLELPASSTLALMAQVKESKGSALIPAHCCTVLQLGSAHVLLPCDHSTSIRAQCDCRLPGSKVEASLEGQDPASCGAAQA